MCDDPNSENWKVDFHKLEFPSPKQLRNTHVSEFPDMTISNEALLEREDICKIVLKVILIWSQIEREQQVITLRLLGDKSDDYLTARSPNARDKLERKLDEVAKKYADEEWRAAFEKSSKMAQEIKDFRHQFTHHSWARSSAFQDELLLIKPFTLSEARSRSDEFTKTFQKNPLSMTSDSFENVMHAGYPARDMVYVWGKDDFKKVMELTKAAMNTYCALRDCLEPSAAYIKAGVATRQQVLNVILEYKILSIDPQTYFGYHYSS